MSQLEMESMIDRYIGDIDTLKGKIKDQTAMYNDSFKIDKEYEEHSQKVKEATRLRNGVKQRIMKQPAVMQLGDEMKRLKDELKDLNNALAGYVQQYQRLTNSNQITLPSGEIMQIVLVPKLKRITKDTP